MVFLLKFCYCNSYQTLRTDKISVYEVKIIKEKSFRSDFAVHSNYNINFSGYFYTITVLQAKLIELSKVSFSKTLFLKVPFSFKV